MIRLGVFFLALILGGLTGHVAYDNPAAAARVAATAATVLAVLASVSLAIFSVLAVRADVAAESDQQRRRLVQILDDEDNAIVDQNLGIFTCLVVSLGLCLATDFLFPEDPSLSVTSGVRWLAAAAGFGTGLSIVLALLLPATLVGVVRRNRGL